MNDLRRRDRMDKPDPKHGIRELVVGTAGGVMIPLGWRPRIVNRGIRRQVESSETDAFAGEGTWEFIPVNVGRGIHEWGGRDLSPTRSCEELAGGKKRKG